MAAASQVPKSVPSPLFMSHLSLLPPLFYPFWVQVQSRKGMIREITVGQSWVCHRQNKKEKKKAQKWSLLSLLLALTINYGTRSETFSTLFLGFRSPVNSCHPVLRGQQRLAPDDKPLLVFVPHIQVWIINACMSFRHECPWCKCLLCHCSLRLHQWWIFKLILLLKPKRCPVEFSSGQTVSVYFECFSPGRVCILKVWSQYRAKYPAKT